MLSSAVTISYIVGMYACSTRCTLCFSGYSYYFKNVWYSYYSISLSVISSVASGSMSPFYTAFACSLEMMKDSPGVIKSVICLISAKAVILTYISLVSVSPFSFLKVYLTIFL